MMSTEPKTSRRACLLIALVVALLTSACLAGCATHEATSSTPTAETPAEQDDGNGPKFCIETATDVPAIAVWSPINLTPGEPLPDSLIQALGRFMFTRRVLDLPDLPLHIDDFERIEVGRYQEALDSSIRNDLPIWDDAHALDLYSTDGISGVPGSRNAIVYVWRLWPEDEPESWYIYDWRYELPCPPGFEW